MELHEGYMELHGLTFSCLALTPKWLKWGNSCAHKHTHEYMRGCKKETWQCAGPVPILVCRATRAFNVFTLIDLLACSKAVQWRSGAET